MRRAEAAPAGKSGRPLFDLNGNQAMKTITLLALTLLHAGLAQAGPYSDDLARCFSDSTTGKDRTNLARWFFTGMAAHPAMKDMSVIKPDVQESISKSVGILYTRLTSEDCAQQARAVVQNEGAEGLKAGYETLGKLAMQEVLLSPAVGQVFAGVEKYVDMAKIKPILSK